MLRGLERVKCLGVFLREGVPAKAFYALRGNLESQFIMQLKENVIYRVIILHIETLFNFFYTLMGDASF